MRFSLKSCRRRCISLRGRKSPERHSHGGADCIDLAAQQAHCTLTFQITGGTGRFKNASGTLSLTETVVPVAADALNNRVFFTDTGEITGTVSGVAKDDDNDDRDGRH